MEEYMKKLRMLLVLVGLVALMASIPAAAQTTYSGPSFEVKFSSKVPFYAGDKLMEPGDYTIRQGAGVQADTLLVRGKGKNEAYVQSRMSKIDGITKSDEVTFKKVGDKLYMDAVKLASEPNKPITWQFKVRSTAAEADAAKDAGAPKQ
jgi:hypothetical protein